MDEQTIVAVATPPGRGGVGIVRLSGCEALSIARAITQKKTFKPRTFYFCSFFDEQQRVIDKGLVLYFKSPHSFTGEDVIEFHTHGSPIVQDEVIRCALLKGARLARAGEFSERAFLNDKMDLTQAEAIADLIDASSLKAARMAVHSLQGAFSTQINALADKMIVLRVYVEAAIDFPDEEIDFLSDPGIALQLNALQNDLKGIIANASQGALIREGLYVVIAGPPNAGKSTLINALAQKEVAIVTHIAGTTRDVMREQILIDDIPIHIVDTAGLRQTDDLVEKMGIERAYSETQKADCILLMEDLSSPCSDEMAAIYQQLPSHVPVIKIKNKIDLAEEVSRQEENTLYISAHQGIGIDLLKQQIKKTVGYQPSEGGFLARRRHLDALHRALSYLEQGQTQLSDHRAGELLAEDLRLAHLALTEITGAYHSDDLLGDIFSSFCIGK